MCASHQKHFFPLGTISTLKEESLLSISLNFSWKIIFSLKCMSILAFMKLFIQLTVRNFPQQIYRKAKVKKYSLFNRMEDCPASSNIQPNFRFLQTLLAGKVVYHV